MGFYGRVAGILLVPDWSHFFRTHKDTPIYSNIQIKV